MFVVLGDVLELLVAYCAVERPKGFCDFGLDVCSAGDVVLSYYEHPRVSAGLTITDLSFRALVVALLEQTLGSQLTAL